MVTRYCGQLKITLKYVSREAFEPLSLNGYYDCLVSHPGDWSSRQRVREPAHLDRAVDSPDAYDSAAHAALSFAMDEGFPVGDQADYTSDGSGYLIRRKKEHPHLTIGFQGPRVMCADVSFALACYLDGRDPNDSPSSTEPACIEAIRDAVRDYADPHAFDHWTRRAWEINDEEPPQGLQRVIGLARCWYNSRWDH